MSYILDALKKAEAERSLGSVPNIHAQPVFSAPPAGHSGAWRRRWPWIVLPAAAVALAASALLKPWQAPPPSVAMLPPEQASPVVPDAAPAAPRPAPETDDAKPQTAAPRKKTPVKKAAETKPATASANAESDAQPAAGERVTALNELPAEIRKKIPALNVNGYLYSKNKADRTVLIDHKLRQEGDQVAPDVVLEQLLPDGMVLNYKGYRYRTAY